MKVDVKDIQRLHLEPGDTLVLRLAQRNAEPELIKWLGTQMQDAFPGHKTVVLTEGMALEVVGAPK